MSSLDSNPEPDYHGGYVAELFDRMTKAGLATSHFHSADKIAMTLTKNGHRIVSAFRELETAIGPLDDADRKLLWFLFVDSKLQI